MLIRIIFIFFFTISPTLSNTLDFAEIRAIDRTTGRSYKLNLPINEEVIFSNLILEVKYCYKNPIDREIENYAYISVTDKLLKRIIFQGWIFSSSPSLSSLEHPINDIWLLSCKIK